MRWLKHLAPFDVPFASRNSSVSVSQALQDLVHNPASDALQGLCFVACEGLLKALQYEERVATRAIPTRDCAHDWYNGLVWLAFPRSKTLINRLHLVEIQGGEVGKNGRTPRRDALTLFDENGAVLVTSDTRAIEALKNFDWDVLFGELRPLWQDRRVCLYVFGHGLLEALDCAHKGLCAKVLCVHAPGADCSRQQLDAWVEREILHLFTSRQLNPLPVMGVPGWFEAVRYPDFYQDRSVFRSKPTQRS